MKKAISLSIILLIILLVYQLGINFIKQEHSVQYSINTKEGTYKIKEDYSSKDNDSYILKVKHNNHSYVFEVENEFNKQREIVKNVISYDKDDVNCISLEFVNKNINVEPLCTIGDTVYSYTYIKDKYDISEFLGKIKNFDFKKYEKESAVREDYSIKVNKEYLDEDELIIIYDLKRIAIHNGINSSFFTFATSDQYKNTIGIKVGNYYVIPKMAESATINNFIRYDLQTDIKKEIPAPQLSKQFYINGVYEDKLYIFDKSSKKQYVLDPEKETIDVVSDENEAIVVKNGKEEKMSVYDLAQNNVLFTDDYSAYSSIDYEEIYIDGNYALYLKDGLYYRVYKKYVDSPIVLFDKGTKTEIRVSNKNVYYIQDDTIYRYNEYGSVPLVVKKEFKYNSDNIYDVYFKD